MKEKTQLISDSLARINDWTKTADTKVAGIGAITAILIAVMKDITSTYVAFANKTLIKGVDFWWFLSISIVLVLILYALVRTLIILLLAMKARTKNTKQNLLFFGHISALSQAQYLKAMRAKTTKQLEEDLINQTHTNAVIATKKYALVNQALVYVVAAAILILVELVLLAIYSV